MQDTALSAQFESGYEPVCAASVIAARGRPSASLKIEAHQVGARTAVVIAGEIDLDGEQLLKQELRRALAGSVTGVDLDLSGVEFCDCSGLNVLLRLRRRALKDAKTVVVQAAGPVVERLLALTETSSLFAPTYAPTGDAARAVAALPDQDARPDRKQRPTEEDALPDDAERDLRAEVVQLKRAMQTRPVIDLARGVLMASFGLSPENAWNVLVAVSQNTNTKLHHLAEDMVGAVQGDPLPEPLQQQLAAAVAELTTPPPTNTTDADTDDGDPDHPNRGTASPL
ncbi:ANTAR domain-containing protein [Streptomyces liliifuscus]|uniref:ANTAR domain-containing protein n=1 Tax=Streptomyces liliifuscus TaxID=2797636 RepID=A0A7T7I0Y4_9ACTN|nr:ANTAR domain-containing protein [Streptomyces liliifuscus]QQM38947.1 ANTAR domain-containing protein [Streptomyces liliifuscus]